MGSKLDPKAIDIQQDVNNSWWNANDILTQVKGSTTIPELEEKYQMLEDSIRFLKNAVETRIND